MLTVKEVWFGSRNRTLITLGGISACAAILIGGGVVINAAIQDAKNTDTATQSISDCIKKAGPLEVFTANGKVIFTAKVNDAFLNWNVIDVTLSDAKPNEPCLSAGGRDACNPNKAWYDYNVHSRKFDYQTDLSSEFNPRVVRDLALNRLNRCVRGYDLPMNPR